MQSQLNVLYPKRAIRGTTPVVSQSTAVSTAAVAPTGYTAANAGSGGPELVTFDIQLANVVARWDGVDPTSSVGHVLASGQAYTWSVSQYNAAKFIRQGATDAVVFASPMMV